MSTERAQPVKDLRPVINDSEPTHTAGQPTAGWAWPLAGMNGLIHGPRWQRPQLTVSQVVALQRLAGNAAVASLLERAGARRAPGRMKAMHGSLKRLAAVTSRRARPTAAPVRQPSPALQRQGPAEAPAQTDMTPEERIDAATFAGFNAWAEAAIADADETSVDAAETANRLQSPYQHRLNMLIQDVVNVRNPIDNGKYALGQGHPVPGLTADPEGRLLELEDRIAELRDVTDAWDHVMSSGILRLLAAIAESQVALARRLHAELQSLLDELRELERIAAGAGLREAFAQTGANAAITIGVMVLSALVPPAGVALAVGAAVVQLTLDHCLGSPPGALSYGASTSSIAGARLSLPRYTPRLQTVGRRLGAVGAAAGTVSDILETREAIQAYEAAAARLRVVGARIDRIVPQLNRLMPILEHPDLVERMIDGMRNHADTLRENGQVTLATHGQL